VNVRNQKLRTETMNLENKGLYFVLLCVKIRNLQKRKLYLPQGEAHIESSGSPFYYNFNILKDNLLPGPSLYLSILL
jgi:hypothetical protein